MSNPKDPTLKGTAAPRGALFPGTGRSARPGAIGDELGELDFEPDALLDSLLSESPMAPAPGPILDEEVTTTTVAPGSPQAPPPEDAWDVKPTLRPETPTETTSIEDLGMEIPRPPHAAGFGTKTARLAVPRPGATLRLDPAPDLVRATQPPKPRSSTPPALPLPPQEPFPLAHSPVPPNTRASSNPPVHRSGAPRSEIPRPRSSSSVPPGRESQAPLEVLERISDFEEILSEPVDDLATPIDEPTAIREPSTAPLRRSARPFDDTLDDPRNVEILQTYWRSPDGKSSAPPPAPFAPAPFASEVPPALDTTQEAPAPEVSLPFEAQRRGAPGIPEASSRSRDGRRESTKDRPASVHLTERGALDSFVRQAEWFELAAGTAQEGQGKARLLLVASELWAMVGDLDRARSASRAAAATNGAPALVSRQLRWLATQQGDFKTVAASLETEMRASPSPAARVHGALLSAEIHRLKLDDEDGVQRKLEIAARILPGDPRAHLLRIARQLGSSAAPPKLPLPEVPALQGIAEGLAEVTARRSGQQTERFDAVLAFHCARQALASGNAAQAAEALIRLSQLPGLNRAALWLAASLLGTEASTRPQAIAVLQQLLADQPTPATLEALAKRAIEQNDPATVEAILAHDQAQVAFAPEARIALAALARASQEGSRSFIKACARNSDWRPLATAACSLSQSPGEPLEVESGSETSRARVGVGRAVAAGKLEGLRDAVERLHRQLPEATLSQLLGLELALLDKDAELIAEYVANWPGGDRTSAPEERDRQLLAGLILEGAGQQQTAQSAYSSALEADPSSLAAARALASLSAPQEAADVLARVADAIPLDAQKALLLTEAALRLGTQDAELAVSLLRRAAEADPNLPFASRQGEHLARTNADVDQLLDWLRTRRDCATDPVERALDATREALLVADSNLELSKALVEGAILTRPHDSGLHELLERLSPEPSVSRGLWREEAAVSADPTSQAILLTAAALEYEAAGATEQAAHSAEAAAASRPGEISSVIAERTIAASPAAALFSEKLFAAARSELDPVAQRELYERLSRLDQLRGDQSSAMLWQSAILERSPNYLPALRRLEHAYLSAGRTEELVPIATALVPLLDRNEAAAHAHFASHRQGLAGDWNAGFELTREVLSKGEPNLWTLRELSAQARAAHADELCLEADTLLYQRSTCLLDSATLSLRAAEAATRMGQLDRARELLDQAVEAVPEHLVALTTQAEVLDTKGDSEGAALALEAAAQTSRVPAHQVELWRQAAVLWLEKVGENRRGRLALEHAAEIDIHHEDVFSRLRQLYATAGETALLAELLERRLAETTDPEERVALEVARGRALSLAGNREGAKAALLAALTESPNRQDALEVLAELCLQDQDFLGAEQALLRLARHAASPEGEAIIHRRLGELYMGPLANPEQAEAAYVEVRKRLPNDTDAADRLIQVYGQLQRPGPALLLAHELLERAPTSTEKCQRTLLLARVEEEIARDAQAAETTLDQARKTWPGDPSILRALVQFHQRQGNGKAASVLLDRAATEARRALQTGRFEIALLQTLGTVAELRGGPGAAQLAQTTQAVLEGETAQLSPAHALAGDPALDDLLATELCVPSFRALFHRSGNTLDAAFPFDLRAVRAARLRHLAHPIGESTNQLASAFGLPEVELYVTSALGPVCVPASSEPPRIVVGQKLLESTDEDARRFMLIRALKIIQLKASALSRAAPIDLWPMLAGFLASLTSGWTPIGVSPEKLEETKAKVLAVLDGGGVAPDISVLALEVAGALGNRASQLGLSVNNWGNRVGLLATGDLAAAMRGIAFAQGNTQGPPPAGPERMKWFSRNPEARDLAIFSVSEPFAKARALLRLE